MLAAHTAAWAQTPAAAASLPIGSPLTIISDATIDPRVRPGTEFRAHLRDPLDVGSTLVATAGTPARLVVVGKDTARDGSVKYRIAVVGLNLGMAGTLPVKPDASVVERIVPGTAIPVTTLASLGYQEGKIRVAIPLPFTLSNEPPNGGYTPAPLRTAAPIVQPRRRAPRGSPSPSPSPSPSTIASPAASTGPDGTGVSASAGPATPAPIVSPSATPAASPTPA